LVDFRDFTACSLAFGFLASAAPIPRVEVWGDLWSNAGMELILELPDAEAGELSSGLGDLKRATIESLAATGYREGVLSLGQVQRVMGFDNRWDAEAVLKKHGVWPGMTVEDVLQDIETLETFLDRK